MGCRLLDHTADIGVEVDGATLVDLFRQGAAALIALLTDRAAIAATGVRAIRVEGLDRTDLWINYLREILYLFNSEGFLVREAEELIFSPSNGGAGRDGETDRFPGGKGSLAAASRVGASRVLAGERFPAAGTAPAKAPAAQDREDGPAAGDEGAGGAAGLSLTARCAGEVCDPRRHIITTEIKAVTYHHAEVEPTPAGWRGVFIVDV